MSILEQIKADQLAARKARDTLAASLLTTLLGEATGMSTDEFKANEAAIAAGKPGFDQEAKAIQTVEKFLKSAKSNRELLASVPAVIPDVEREIQILSGYLPEQMTAEQIQMAINLFRQGEPEANVGQIMAHLKANYAGLYDGKLASQMARG